MREFRLSTTLVVPFVVQIVTAVGLVGYLSFKNGQKAIDDLASQLRTEVTARIHNRIQTYLETPHLVNKINADAVQLGLLDFQKIRPAQPYFWKQVKAFQTIGYVGFANEQGQYTRVGWIDRLSNSDRPQIAEQLTPGGGNFLFYNIDSQGNPTEVAKTLPNYDPRQRPYYTVALKKGQPAWTEPYTNFGYNVLQMNASQPFYDRDGKLLGILTCQLGLNQIGNFLQTLKIGRSGQTFIIDSSGELVASSISNQLLLIEKSKELRRVTALESDNPLMHSSVASLLDRFNSLKGIDREYQLDFMLAGQRQFLQVSPFKDEGGLNWLIVVVVPESDFMEQINANTRTTVLLCFGALVVATALGILTARWIGGQIFQLNKASQAIASGDLNQNVEVNGIVEIKNLAGSFNSMAHQLKQSFEILETKNEALRLAEENYRSIFENALEGIFQSTPEGHYISVNPAMASIYGYDSPEEMMACVTEIGRQIFVDPAYQDEFQRLMQANGKVTNFEYQAYRKDGSIIWVEEDTRAVCARTGKFLYYEGLIQDITQRKRSEEDLKRQLQELRIEIDQHHRLCEVAAITQSDYFQEIQSEVENIQLDEFWS